MARPGPGGSAARGYLKAGSLAAVCGAALFLVMTDGGGAARPVAPLVPELDELADIAGFGIAQVTLTGQRYTPDSDVFDALDLDHARTLASFDSAAARNRIERMAWVKSAVIRRVYPGELVVTIAERDPYAIWQRTDGAVLIDETGRVLTAPGGAHATAGLPVVAGDGAASEAKALMSLVSANPVLTGRVQRAVFVARRRWSLELTSGATIELPAVGSSLALARLAGWSGAPAALATAGTILDLRAGGGIHVRTPGGEGLSAAPDGPAVLPPTSIADLIGRAG
ncbi:MAG: FtsQ-type POTRA domain-containing protein [Hyphomicrobiaceae bacterium]|nr:FtsQ-type POTRA domain-containing protein [Hyphomicrobiaceae bacterium]